MDTGSRTKCKPQGPIAEIAPTSHCCQYIPGKVCVCVCACVGVKCVKPAVESFPTVRAYSILPPLHTTIGCD